jgi:hypothetical protein
MLRQFDRTKDPPRWTRPTVAVTGGRRTEFIPSSFGTEEQGDEPHGCEWLKHATGFGEE